MLRTVVSMRTITDHEIDRLGHAIAADGPARHEATISLLAQLAGAAGAGTTVLEVLTDRGAPEVVRARALSRAVAAIRRCRSDAGVGLAA
jgi:hypothetical protein